MGGHNIYRPKSQGCYSPFGEGEAESPSNTMSPGPSHTSVPSGILIHLAAGHNTPTLQTDRQDSSNHTIDRQDNARITLGERFTNGCEKSRTVLYGWGVCTGMMEWRYGLS